VVWSQRVSPQQRDKKAIEERKRKVTEQEQDQKRHEGKGGREEGREGGREGWVGGVGKNMFSGSGDMWVLF